MTDEDPEGRHRPRAGKPPAFQFYAADFLSDELVGSMTLTQIGAYTLLLMYHWREGSIPADEVRIARLIRLGGSRLGFRMVWTGALRDCFEPHPHLPGRLVQWRMFDALQSRENTSLQRRESGAQGGRNSAQNKAARQANAKQGSSSAVCSLQSASAPELLYPGTSGTPGQIAPPAPLAPAAPPVQKPALSREDIQAQKNAAKVIPAIEKLEAGKPDPFDPGAWWGWAGKQNIPYPSRLDALMALGKRLKAGDRPENVWAYMTKTGNEKRANHYADKAESDSEERRLPERKDRHA